MKPVLIPALAALALVTGAPRSGADDRAEQPGIEAFMIADANGDGELILPEFTVFMQHMAQAGNRSARMVRNFGAYAVAFRQVDANGDGIASPDELLASQGTGPGGD